jgi:aspartyl-tRNA synthetase
MEKKKYNKLIDQIVKTAITAELKGITEQEVINRYNEVLESYGIEKADSALQHTLKQFKERAKEKEKIFWNSVKNETFNKLHYCPCAIRDLKSMIKSGEIDITGFTKEQEIKERLTITINQ